MATKRPSKQKRAAQNRAQRAAREARKAAANAQPVSGTGASAGGARRGGLLSRLRGGGTGASSAASAGRRPTLAEARAMQPPGYRAAMSAVFAAAAAVILCAFMLRYPVDAQGDLYTGETLVADWVATAIDTAQDQPGVDAAALAEAIDDWNPERSDETVLTALWPWSAAIVLPLIGAGITFWAVRRRAGSRVLNRALYATLFGAVLTQGLMLLFIPVVLAVGVAMFQVRKAEAQAMAAAAPADDGVIDVEGEEVEAERLDDDPADADASEPIETEVVEAEVVDDDVEIADAVTVERAEVDEPR